MSTFKDLFSPKAVDYARFRPTYPDALFDWLAKQTPGHALAIDVGTGNGQAAGALARHFEHVLAVDPSQAQLGHARAHARIEYRVGDASATGAMDASADLVTVAQAFHWFDQRAFFSEVRRVLRPDGVLSFWTYYLTRISPEIDALVWEFYKHHLDTYWEPERKLVEEGYRNVQVPFQELVCPKFDMGLAWSCDELLGYLGTWSALKRYVEERGVNVLEEMRPRFEAAWGDAATRAVEWPVVMRTFRMPA